MLTDFFICAILALYVLPANQVCILSQNDAKRDQKRDQVGYSCHCSLYSYCEHPRNRNSIKTSCIDNVLHAHKLECSCVAALRSTQHYHCRKVRVTSAASCYEAGGLLLWNSTRVVATQLGAMSSSNRGDTSTI